LFNTNKNDSDLWLFFIPFWYNEKNLVDYFDSLKSKYNIIYTKDPNYACTLNPEKILFVFEISDKNLYDYFNNKDIKISIFNTEPLNLNARFSNLKLYLDSYKLSKIYDYSLSNIKILNNNGYHNTVHLPYTIYNEENNSLKELNNNTKKSYDFGIISVENPVYVKRRADVVNFLIQNNYSVKVIQGWKEERDKQIAECSILLNIHGSFNNDKSNIFEHIRCDRLLEAGYNILSESSYELDKDFIKKYEKNLKIIEYNDFFNLETYNNIKNRSLSFFISKT
jgi:hypothetical protein